jgi:hypothetical protein
MDAKARFIAAAILIHGLIYKYTKVLYVNAVTKVIIICKLHGEFSQTPNNHINRKSGCPKCAGVIRMTNEEFIKKAILVYGKYENDYSKTEYKNNKTKITYVHKCGRTISQTPNNHLSGHGCGHCGHGYVKTTEEFIKEATSLQENRYLYPRTIYKNRKTPVIITCRKHGDFEQLPCTHLRGHGCPTCVNLGISRVSMSWLGAIENLLGIKLQTYTNGGECEIILESGKKYKLDGAYDDGFLKFAFEFDGDYWHGNPEKYNFYDKNVRNGKTFGDLHQETITKKQDLEKLGWYVVSIWEKDFKRGIIINPDDLYHFFLTRDINEVAEWMKS